MSLKIAQTTLPSTTRLSGSGETAPAPTAAPTAQANAAQLKDGFERPSIAAGPGGCIPGGGCFPPHPLPPIGLPPIGLPPIGGGDLGYRLKLAGMSDSQLQQEKFHQELNLLVSQFTGDTAGAADAKRKLGEIRQEETRRALGGGIGHQLEMAMYRNKLHGMSNSELGAEERKQQTAYWMARLTGNDSAAQTAKEKLDAVHQEQDSRWLRFPIDPLPLPPVKLPPTRLPPVKLPPVIAY